MSDTLRLLLLCFSIILLSIILKNISKNKIPIKYSLFWIFSSLIIMFVSIFPNCSYYITELVGFQTTSNFVIGLILFLLLILTLIQTIILSAQSKKIILLIQELSLLKKEINEEENEK